MKFLDLVNNVNEEASNEEYVRIIERLRTRAGLIYKALSEGHIMVKCYDGSYDKFILTKMRYVLPETPRINFEDRFDDNDKIVSYGALMSAGEVKLYYKPIGLAFEVDWFDAVAPIRKKFRSLDINIVFDGIDLIEEQPVLNESVNKDEESRLRKRVKVIYNALKTGTVDVVKSKYIDDVKCKYELTSHPIIRIDGVYAKREDGYDRLDANNNPILLRYKQTVQIYDVSVDCKIPEEPDSAHIFTHEIADHIKNKFKSFDINCYIRTIKFSDDKEMLNEAVLKKPEVPEITPEHKERLEKKINVILKASTQVPITVLGHKVNVRFGEYTTTINPSKVIKYVDEYDREVSQLTEPDLLVLVPKIYLETSSKEVYNALNDANSVDLNYDFYHQMRAKVKKFGVSLTYHNTYIRYVGEDNDLQEQFEYGDDDGEEDYIYVDNGTPSQEKKIKVLYKAFKEGYIKMRFDGELYKFRYVLPNKFGAKYSKVSDAMTLLVPKFSIKLYGTNNQLIYPNNPVTKQLHLTAYRLVSRRFQINFGVIFEEPPVGYDKYQSINGDLQEEVSNNQLTDKDLKKAKAIYTFLKTGFINYKSVVFLQSENYKIRYYLQDNYSVKKDSSGKLTIYFTENIYNVIKLFAEKEDGTKTLIEHRSNMWFATEFAVTNKIVNKFRQFDINIKIS